MVEKNEQGKESLVTNCKKIHSIDCVSSPALSGGIVESHYDRLKELNEEDLQEASKRFIEQIGDRNDDADAVARFMEILKRSN